MAFGRSCARYFLVKNTFVFDAGSESTFGGLRLAFFTLSTITDRSHAFPWPFCIFSCEKGIWISPF
jgi:hypothetical protein